MNYHIPVLIPATDGLFDRHNCKREVNGWLFYIGGGLENPKIVVVSPEEMASQGSRKPLVEIPIQNDEQFYRWVLQFCDLNGITVRR